MIITMKDVRAAGMCSYGARKFCQKYNIDWQEFLKNGIDANELLKTKDGMAEQVVKVAENGRN